MSYHKKCECLNLSPQELPTEKAKIWAPPGRPNGLQELRHSCLVEPTSLLHRTKLFYLLVFYLSALKSSKGKPALPTYKVLSSHFIHCH